MAIQYGTKIAWGPGSAPPLPVGYSLKEDLIGIQKAINGIGQEFLIALNPSRLVPVAKIVNGETWWDFDNAIPF